MYKDFGVKDQAMLQNDVLMVTKDLVGELDAIMQYGEHIRSTDNQMVIKTLSAIRAEEQKHAGELLSLLFVLEPEFKQNFDIGKKEFEEMNNL